MNDGVPMQPGAWGQVRVREPAGERVLGETLSIGGTGSDVVVPGVDAGAALSVRRRPGLWLVQPAPGAVVRFNGRPLTAERDLRRDDVLSVGDAQVRVSDATRTLLRLSVEHLAGNVTIAPAAALAALSPGDGGDQDLEIQIPGTLMVPRGGAPTKASPGGAQRAWWLAVAAGVAAVALLAARLGSVALDVHPQDARVRTPGALSVHLGQQLLVFPGRRIVRAERDGYMPAQAAILVQPGAASAVRLALAKLPGQLQIDTAGVVAAVSIDGVAAGLAPGVLSVPAGERTVSLRAPRYVDYATRLTIQGAGARQDLHARLQPAWGNLTVIAVPQGAHVSVDGVDSGAAPVTIAAPSGVRRIRIAAAGWKTWESSVVLTGGAALTVGPVTLGQPDAHLSVRSSPEGAEVTIAGTHRGRAPLAIELPAGIAYPVIVSLPGHASWTQEVFATAGRTLTADARLTPLFARLKVAGDPADAELLIDGTPRGQTPQSLNLPASEHRIEVRKAGFVSFEAIITPVPELERAVQYHLTPSDRGRALLESAPLIRSQIGYLLRLVPPGTFQMGSERREQGRRPNEGLRSVTLQRPFYIGVQAVTNGEFRKFRAAHASGYIDRQSIDLDSQPVTQVSWDDAAEFCNWLSQQDGLPPAYARSGSGFVLTRPVTRGYRLPTEAEWEYAARYGASGESHRFAWGDSLPVPQQVGNLAGSETGSSLPATLPGYRDDYPLVAPVGKFRPTALGLHDMSGNVSQWVNDYYESFVDAASVTDPLGPESGTLHVVRGANWKTASVSELRLAWRDTANGPEPTLGFRVARYAEDAR
ncbi:MAG TPA: SUMF1/EgtB/PvdO family nonheme iron enzyme [Steroidobacteraceae bacterium]